jgi:hypothetical protein
VLKLLASGKCVACGADKDSTSRLCDSCAEKKYRNKVRPVDEELIALGFTCPDGLEVDTWEEGRWGAYYWNRDVKINYGGNVLDATFSLRLSTLAGKDEVPHLMIFLPDEDWNSIEMDVFSTYELSVIIKVFSRGN